MCNRRGFTLIETVVLVGIFGIMTAISIPAISNYLRTNRLDTSTSQLAADLNISRTTSISSGRVYRLAATATGYQVVNTATGSVLRDRQFEGDVTLAAGDTINFFPWGMADAATFDLQSCAGSRTVTLLPTGVVEVQ